MLLSYAFTPEIKLTGGVVNGWDNVIDSNDGKSFLGSLSYAPIEQVSLALNGIYGAEQPNHGGPPSAGVGDFVATIKPVDNLALILNYDYGSETDLGPPGADGFFTVGNTTDTWNAFSGIVTYDLPDQLIIPIGFALRGEYFDDSASTRLGGVNAMQAHVVGHDGTIRSATHIGGRR